jgi:hypothetical protein
MTKQLATLNDKLSMKLEIPKDLEGCITFKELKGGKGTMEGYDSVRRAFTKIQQEVNAKVNSLGFGAKKIVVSRTGISFTYDLPKTEVELIDDQAADLRDKLAKLEEKKAKLVATPAAAAIEA